jgi:ABC-type antimicrobial peptide transport system permease subunit
MLTRWQLIQRSLLHHWRSNLAIAMGVAAATAVLSGALMVGDSMRGSLRGLTLDRLAGIDQLIVSEGFFREALADDLQNLDVVREQYDQVVPVIFFPGGTVENESANARSSNVTVIGANENLIELGSPENWPGPMPTGESVVINQALAEDLGVTAADVEAGEVTLTLRIPKRDQLPSDSSLGKKEGLIESLVGLKVDFILPTAGLGRFGLHPTQADPLNIYVPIDLLQDALSRTVLKHKSSAKQANMLMLSSKGDELIPESVSDRLRKSMRPAMEDLGLIMKRATLTFSEPNEEDDEVTTSSPSETVFDYWALSSDRLVMNDSVAASIQKTFPDAKPIFTYLANDIRIADSGEESGVPFSMVASIDFDSSFQPESAVSGDPIKALNETGKNEIVLNQWAADDLEAKVGDEIELTFFEPESEGGKQVELVATFTLVDIAKLVEPDEGPIVRRRGKMEPAIFSARPTLANDMYLTPEVPGLTDAASIENWDLPFETADKIRSEDDEYWTLYRTTPKAFVSLAAGQKLWNSRFGNTTGFRIPISAGDRTQIEQKISSAMTIDQADTGLQLVDIKRRGLEASSGSTPFDVLFLALSMFVIASALILVALLFRLALQQRASELGVMAAVGLDQATVRRNFMLEMLLVAAIGAWLGIQLGVAYAATIIYGLTTWWVGAISRPFLKLHISPTSLVIGLLFGLLVCVVTIFWSLRAAGKQNPISLLAGQLDEKTGSSAPKPARRWLVWLLVLIALGLSVMATGLAGEAQAGAFMGAGFLVLVAMLMSVLQWLKQPSVGRETTGLGAVNSLSGMASRAASRNPLRSALTMGLVAVASFLIVAVSSFRLSPNESGTAGFDWIATSSQPIIDPIDLAESASGARGPSVFSFRYQDGEDASCNNLYQSTQPRVLGVPQTFVRSFDEGGENHDTPFAWGGNLAKDDVERSNPWRLLNDQVHAGTEEDPIPVLIDKNTANYSLKIYLPGTVFKVDYDSGQTIHFVAVGFLANTILQGSLIASEQDFLNAFPSASGYQYFLIKESSDSKVAADLESRFEDYGFDARAADTTLAGFMSVQNTYLSTFQSLGGLGLLLGTFGLAAVQLRSVLERKRELALMQAVGFGRAQLSRMILLENVWLLTVGLGIGVAAALFSTLPHWVIGNASIPWIELMVIFAAILLAGLLAAWLASRVVARMPLLESLRV